MSSEVEGASSAFLFSACIHALQARSGPKSIANRFSRFRKLSSAVIATFDPMPPSNALRPCLNPTGEEALPSLFGNHPISSGSFGESSVGQSWRFRRRKKTGTSRLHAFDTFMRPYALRMQPYAVRMHFFGSSKKLGGSRAESTCKKPYALYAPLLGVGVFLALFLLRELHTVHTAAYG